MYIPSTTLVIALAAAAHAKVAPEWLQENHSNGDNPPTGKVDDVQKVVLTGGRDALNQTQDASCPTIMIGTAKPSGDKDTGWKELPTVAGFDVKRLVVDDDTNATLPYFIENTKDFSQIKRAIVTIAGARRNGWQYANDMRNALVCAAGKDSVNANMDRVLVTTPQWLNEDDVDAGAATPDDIYFESSDYQKGSAAVGPGDVNLSSFEAMDKLVDTFWNKDIYPELETVVIASHSLGAQMIQRYAMLRPTQPKDSNVHFGVMNPGSYVWPVTDRPDDDNTCNATYNDWPYGISDNEPDAFPKYVRSDAVAGRSDIRERYFSRNIFYGLGLKDHGKGDSNCQAQWQGSTHLGRGRNFDSMLKGLSAGFPKSQSVHYIEGVAHQDYDMFISDAMQRKMFLFEEQ
ncbi:uncharacterized protein APUU_20349S [Aspergillus puulaauensis]|uniref:Uncharacterized protein n=1 Tax=Aspergillus puulaauensis TaxID=1220207 RepID=A0A7R8AIW4_9EURO|nr:uncharacterized protein APUU_20349S [Aspergillus puulaauensis]BCS19917.1 hypothetical protein APUU_20349S [Aspergillus puulaauensis]